MARFTVWIVQPPQDTAPQCLLEVAAGVAHSLRRLGHEVAFDPGKGPYIQNPLPAADGTFGRLIVFNAHRLPAVPLPADAIIFNAEQVQVDSWASSEYVKLLRRHLVWDYSETNAANLKTLGVDRVAVCRVGYYPESTHIEPVKNEDVDVLFVGSVNERRAKVFQEIAQRRLVIRTLYGVYGEERDRWIARAKVVLNVHFYPNPIWEVFRVSYLLANKKAVVSEDGGLDEGLECVARETTAHVPYEKLAEMCATLVRDKEWRQGLALKGHLAFQMIDQEQEVLKALERS